MTEGLSYWYAEDALYLKRTLVVELGSEFGPAAVGVLMSLKCDAKLQDTSGGTVKTGFLTVARDAFVEDPELVRKIVERAAEIGVLDDLQVAPDGRRFTCRISGWSADQSKAKAAVRQAQKRARDAAAAEEPKRHAPSQDVTPGNGVSRIVTHTGQDRTEENSSLRGASPKILRFNGKPLTPELLSFSELILKDFNYREGTKYAPYTAAGKLTEPHKRIIGALTEHPEIDKTLAARIHEVSLNADVAGVRFWDGPAQPGHVWGPNVVDGNIAKAQGARPTADVDRWANVEEDRRRQRDDSRRRMLELAESDAERTELQALFAAEDAAS